MKKVYDTLSFPIVRLEIGNGNEWPTAYWRLFTILLTFETNLMVKFCAVDGEKMPKERNFVSSN